MSELATNPDVAHAPPNKPNEGVGKKAFPHRRVAIIVFGVALMVSVAAQTGYYLIAGRGWRFMAEYLSYVLPAFAALLAAMTVFNKAVMWLFWFATIFVVAGLFLYIGSQGNLSAVIQTGIMVLASVALSVAVAVSNLIDKKNGESRARHFIVGGLFLLMIVVEGYAWTKLAKEATFHKTQVKLTCVETYRDKNGHSSLTCTGED